MQGFPVPPELPAWTKIAMQYENPYHAALSALSLLVIKVCDLRARLCDPTYYKDPHRIVADALALDGKFQDWALTLPPAFAWATINVPESDPEVFEGFYNVYEDIFAASSWNSYRLVRIRLHEVLLMHLFRLCEEQDLGGSFSDVPSVYRSQISASRSVMHSLTREICASVPYFLNHHLRDREKGYWTPPKAIVGYMLMWPLYTAVIAGKASSQMREWIAGMLVHIGVVMGVRHAGALGVVVRERREVCVWESRGEDDDWDRCTKEIEIGDHDE